VSPGARWPAGVILALAATVAVNLLMLRAATSRDAAVVEPDYYRKALAWDSTLAARRHDAALGWRLEAMLERAGRSGADLVVSLADREGRPLAGAGITVTAIHNAEARRPVAAMRTGADGVARARLPLARPGRWELRLEARHAGETFSASLRRERP
jgi:nitrogen fixation protein FixH